MIGSISKVRVRPCANNQGTGADFEYELYS